MSNRMFNPLSKGCNTIWEEDRLLANILKGTGKTSTLSHLSAVRVSSTGQELLFL